MDGWIDGSMEEREGRKEGRKEEIEGTLPIYSELLGKLGKVKVLATIAIPSI